MFLIFLILALCIDAFAASFAYGINQTRIPVASMAVVGLICTAVSAVSAGIGSAAKQVIPPHVSGIICFAILLMIGLLKSFECFLKRYIAGCQNHERRLQLKMFDIHFALTVYADNMEADADQSKVLSPKEAVYLALALSLDGFAAGFGCGLADIDYAAFILLSLASNILAISFGSFLGRTLKRFSKTDFSWIGGIILIILAFSKLLH